MDIWIFRKHFQNLQPWTRILRPVADMKGGESSLEVGRDNQMEGTAGSEAPTPPRVGRALNTIHGLLLGLPALSVPQEAFPVRSLDHLRRRLLLFPAQGAADWYIRHLEVRTANKTK